MATCLVVDESNVIRKVASRIIFQLGYTVESVGTAGDALARLEAGELPSLLIVAATLPDMQGEQLVRAIRTRAGGGEIVILAALVESNLGLMTRLKRAGANGFVYKPFNRAALTRWLAPYEETEAA